MTDSPQPPVPSPATAISDSAIEPNALSDQHLSSYDYILPSENIAQNPAVPRDSSRLLVVVDNTQHHHRLFRDLPTLLQPGDLLVMNNTRVIPARLYGQKLAEGGAQVELLLLEPRQSNCWLALVKPGKRLKPGARIKVGQSGAGYASGSSITGAITGTIMAVDEATGGRIVEFDVPAGTTLLQLLEHLGEMPLPPYITDSAADPEQYQTVYGDRPGAVAAPTAGLHFTPELLQRLSDEGIGQAYITLHVGVGTFRPVEVEDITQHAMHGEWLEVSADTVDQIRRTQAQGGRIIAVGTTVVRALETAAQDGTIAPFSGKSEMFIYPGYRWRVVDGLITNFHLPKSSLMMLVSALIGRQRLLDLYQEAIAQNYRFYSFGDAMLVLPPARLQVR